MTQCEHIEHYMKTRGAITPMQALRLFDCNRLAARVAELRAKGLAIQSERFKLASGKYIARYSLA